MVAPSWFGFERIGVGLVITLLATCTADAERDAGKRKRRSSRVDTQMMHAEMPGESYRGQLPELTEGQVKVRDALRRDLARLAGVIGERNLNNPENYAAAALFIEKSLQFQHALLVLLSS